MTLPTTTSAESIVKEAVASTTDTPAAAITDTTSEVPKTDDDFAHRFAALARKEKGITEKEREIKSLQSQIDRMNRLEKLAKDDPEAYLSESGLSVDALINSVLSKKDKNSPEAKYQTLEEKLAAIEGKLSDKDKQERDSKIEASLTQFKNKIKETVDADAEKYDTIHRLGEYELVFEVCASYYDRNKDAIDSQVMKPLELSRACELVEDELFKKVQLLRDSSKVKKLFAPAAELPQSGADNVSSAKEMVTPNINTKTLTAKAVPSTSEPALSDKKLLSREESLKKIGADLQRQLDEKKRLRASA